MYKNLVWQYFGGGVPPGADADRLTADNDAVVDFSTLCLPSNLCDFMAADVMKALLFQHLPHGKALFALWRENGNLSAYVPQRQQLMILQ